VAGTGSVWLPSSAPPPSGFHLPSRIRFKAAALWLTRLNCNVKRFGFRALETRLVAEDIRLTLKCTLQS
jgi:hypothetical protein